MKSLCPLCLIFIALLALVSSCEKCVEQQVADLTFTPEELKIHTYKSGDTLLFENLNHDSLIFCFDSRNLYHEKTSEIDPETAKWDNNGCAGNYMEADKDFLHFEEATDSTSGMGINLDFLYRFDNRTNDKLFSLYISLKNNVYSHFDYKFAQDTLMSYDSLQTISFHPAVQLGSVSYENIYEFRKPSSLNGIQKVYYSIDEGVVSFELTPGDVFYLKK